MRPLLALMLCAALSGCSFFAPWTQTMHVSSDPNGAEVWVDGELQGHTPVSFSVWRTNNAFIEVKKEGYKTQWRTTSRSLSGVGTVDVFGGCFLLVPFLGLLAPGSHAHDPDSYGFTLEQVEQKPAESREGM